jgi:hypothetical protein
MLDAAGDLLIGRETQPGSDSLGLPPVRRAWVSGNAAGRLANRRRQVGHGDVQIWAGRSQVRRVTVRGNRLLLSARFA